MSRYDFLTNNEGLSDDFMRKLWQIESSGRHDIVNQGHYGIGQVGPGALKDVNRYLGKNYTLQDLLTPSIGEEVSTVYGTKIIPNYLRNLGLGVNDQSAWMAYNQGAGGLAAIRDYSTKGTPITGSALTNLQNNYYGQLGKFSPDAYVDYWTGKWGNPISTEPRRTGYSTVVIPESVHKHLGGDAVASYNPNASSDNGVARVATPINLPKEQKVNNPISEDDKTNHSKFTPNRPARSGLEDLLNISYSPNEDWAVKPSYARILGY